jgi:hypothetical protein
MRMKRKPMERSVATFIFIFFWRERKLNTARNEYVVEIYAERMFTRAQKTLMIMKNTTSRYTIVHKFRTLETIIRYSISVGRDDEED